MLTLDSDRTPEEDEELFVFQCANAQPRRAQPSHKQPLETELTIILKGSGAIHTNVSRITLQFWARSNASEMYRRYLNELICAKVEYVDEKTKRKVIAGKQNIPLIYGESMLGSDNWDK